MRRSRIYFCTGVPSGQIRCKELPGKITLVTKRGDLCSGALSNAYYPPANRGAKLVFTNAAIALAARAGQGVLEEFIGKRFTKNRSGFNLIGENETKHRAERAAVIR